MGGSVSSQAADLTARLARGGISLDADALLDLVDGVNASALEPHDQGWMALIGQDLDEALQDGLAALRTSRQTMQAGAEIGSERRLRALRTVLAEAGVDGLVLPRADEHQGEFLPRCAERLAWLTGFTGSAGIVVILPDKAAVFTDGRYTLQVRQQVDLSLYHTRHIHDESPADWIREHLQPGQVLGFDPWLHTKNGLETLSRAATDAGGCLEPLAENPVDRLWDDRPPPPLAPVTPHDIRYAGEAAAAKRLRIAEAVASAGEDAVVLSSPESIAWLLNIRGRDVPCTPLALSFAMLDRDANVTLFIDERKVGREVREFLGNAVSIRPPSALGEALDEQALSQRRIRVDPGTAPAWIARRIAMSGGSVVKGDDPVILPRALKNPVECAGARTAHERDGAAFVRFLHWFADEAPSGNIDEITAAARLNAFRAEGKLFCGLSFETISGTGPNGAIIHYRVTPETNRTIRPGDLYLVDSGAQYLDGTTDITRTIAIGDPGTEARDRFTRVLKGNIALATAVFPVDSPGSRLDTLARLSLWQAGLDFDHGTGHGVGSYLGVHEGPQRISTGGSAPLQPGMIVSNEPGYYREGAFGIRIENLLLVEERQIEGGDRPMLGFEVLTLAPIDRSMIDTGLLNDSERQWVNDYHARVRTTLTPMLPSDVAAWLADATRAIE